MSACALEIAGRIVLRSEGGPPEAEYALVDPSEIELADLGHGVEVGYSTTASDALARLTSSGITASAVENATLALRSVAHAFARGPAVQRVLSELGPAELFDGYVYRASERMYEGLVLDLHALVGAIGIPSAGTTFQALALASVLRNVPGDSPVRLTTLAHTRNGPPAARTFRRVALGNVQRIADALQALTADGARTAEPSPRSAENLLELLREKGLSPERFSRIQHSLNPPPPPSAGPLSEPEAWAIELGLGLGELTGAFERIETLEKSRGKRPVTVYLRSRASLLMGVEAPRTIAERVESLCATQAFPELSLLAAQAWLAAGEPERAVPFARAVLLSTQSSRGARDRADDILAKTPPSSGRNGPPSYARIDGDRRDSGLSPLDRGWDDGSRSKIESRKDTAAPIEAPQARSAKLVLRARPSQRVLLASAKKENPSSRLATTSPRKPSRLLTPRTVAAPPPLPPEMRTRPWVSATPDGGGSSGGARDLAETEKMVPVAQVISLEPRVSQEPLVPAPPRPPSPDQTQRMEASVSTPLALITQRNVPTPPPPPVRSSRSTRPTPSGPAPNLSNRPTPSGIGPTGTPSTTPTGMHGASLPAFQSDPPPPAVEIPRAPRLPRLTPAPPEFAETLSLPPGLHGQIAPLEDELPRTFLEARVLFTHMSRRLGKDYREKHQIQLRTGVESIEQMQAILRERLPGGVIRTREENVFVRRHAAFLSEILARTLEAEWVDIAPTEIGYWAMIVPSSTRVWPFGRVLRHLTRGHRERDLVSYYLELKNRAHRERG